jgi:DNA-binding transcriptional regulator YdaS (Cro superfamily)
MEIRVNKLARVLGFNAEGLALLLSEQLFMGHVELSPNSKLSIMDATRGDMVSSEVKPTTPEDMMTLEQLYQRREYIETVIAKREVIDTLRNTVHKCIDLGITADELGCLLLSTPEGVYESSMNEQGI